MSGIQGKKQSEFVEKGVKKYTGLFTGKVVAINPTKEEAQKILGLEEPIKEDSKLCQYTDLDDNQGNKQNRVVFYLQDDAIVTQVDGTKQMEKGLTFILSLFVAPRENLSKEGKTQTVNRLGLTTWQTVEKIKENDKMKWFQHEPYHNAYIGEEYLLQFVRAWCYLNNDDDCNFADRNKIFSGDVSELRGYLNSFAKDNAITVLLGVSGEKEFQNVYTKAFARATMQNSEKFFAAAIKEPYRGFNSNFQNSFELKVFNPKVVLDTPDSEKTNTSSVRTSDFL